MRLDHLLSKEQVGNMCFTVQSSRAEGIWRRCGQGSHPFPCRTRRLRPDRPRVLHWRRCGRVGGCQNIWGCSSVGRAPALQAGGQGFESLHLHSEEFYLILPIKRTLKTAYTRKHQDKTNVRTERFEPMSVLCAETKDRKTSRQ